MKFKFEPRPAQGLAITAGLKALRSKAKKALVVIATGLGKMLTSAVIAKRFSPKGRILFLVHDNSIIDHAVSEWKKIFGEKVKCAVYNGASKDGATDAQIVFATWQTMGNNLKKWKKNHFDLIVVDEAHHTEATTYAPTVRYFIAPKIGFTATWEREDDADIRDVFGPPVIEITLEQAIAEKWLPRIEYHLVMDESLDDGALQKIVREIHEEHKRFTMAEVNRRLFIKKRDEEIARIIGGYPEKAVVFCASIPHAGRMAKALPLASAFHSKKSRNERRKILSHLRDGTLRQVTAVDAFNEGVDVPSIGLVAFGRVTSSRRIFLQQLGRGLRPGKDKLIVLDFVGNLERIQMVLQMVDKIKGFASYDGKKGERITQTPFEVSGAGFEFTFSDQIVDLMKVLNSCQAEFYETWQEASKAAVALGISTHVAYINRYKKDPHLHSNPQIHYKDFPGWKTFLEQEDKSIYPTWQEASEAVVRLGLGVRNYDLEYKRDPRLPSNPSKYYPNFPGWTKFRGKQKKNFYPTLIEAMKAASRLGFKFQKDYQQGYRRDPRLHSSPNKFYKDFTTWEKFLGRKVVTEVTSDK